MAHNPLEHVVDNDQGKWTFFDTTYWGEGYLPRIGNFQITKFMILEVIAAGIILWLYIGLAKRAKTGKPPRGPLWNALEAVLTFIRDEVARPFIGHHDADRFVPLLWTLFLFILVCNLLGILPFMGSPTASLAVTGALALCSFLLIHGSAVAKHGPFGYLKSYVPHLGFHGWMAWATLPLILMIVVIEIMGHFIKASVLAVRLFANMFGGHTVLAVILSFIAMAKNADLMFWPVTAASVVGVVLLSLLELLVAFIQAFVFVFLTALFLGGTLHPEH
jgi:F-type H+-transporting ATPase subunit a